MRSVEIIFLLIFIYRTNSSFGFGPFCSVICGTNCNGDLSTNCRGSCRSDGLWRAIGGTCDTRSPWVYADSTSDYKSGTMSVSAPLSGTCNGASYFGFVTVDTPITVTSSGIQIPYYQMKIYAGIAALDMHCFAMNGGTGCGSSCPSPATYWNHGTNVRFSVHFDDPQGTETPATNPFSYPAKSGRRNFSCYDCQFRDYWTRVQRLYSRYNSTMPLTWTFTCNQTTNTSALWGLRQFVILVKPCHFACQECWGPSATQCYACVTTGPTIYWLSRTTCNQSCAYRWGPQYDYVCMQCDPKCLSCYAINDNCSACMRSGVNASFLSTTAYAYPTCVLRCSPGQFANRTSRTCDPCLKPNCLQCIFSATYCTKCDTGYYWTGWTCYQAACPSGYFIDPNGTNCTRCSPFCSQCVNTNVTCTACTLSGQFQAYLYNTSGLTGSCLRICPIIPTTTVSYYAETFNNSGPNLCLQCDPKCTICTGNPSPCSRCATGFFLYIDVCTNICPSGFFPSTTTGTGLCLNCDVFCVGLNINMYFPSVVSDKAYIDMQFTEDINFTNFNFSTFQTISITSKNLKYTLDMFTLTYTQISSFSYRIILEPKTYIFLYNATFTVTTKADPGIPQYSLAGMPFKTSNYLKTASLTWFLIKGPPFSTLQTGIMNSLAKLSTKTNNFLAAPYVQQIKKSGVFALLFSGAQITSCSMLSNQIQSQNLYEGVRVFATFVFFDAPPYEQISDKTKRFVSPTVQDQIRNAQQIKEAENKQENQDQSQLSSVRRSLFSTDNIYWRFQRTGQTSFFIYDVYIPMFLIALCWFGVLVINNAKAERWYSAYAPHIYSAVHKIHQISIMYVTMAMIVEFIYFSPTSADRFISMIVCAIFSVYFACYHLYIYYDMIKYPLAQIGNKAYDYYVLRYGSFLRNVRYEEYDLNEKWSPSHWFRPYNYHLLSYYKKFIMIISLPLFYSVSYGQMVVLFIIQCIQIFRLWKTWPFLSNKRNYFRLSLQLALLFFFVVNLIQNSVLITIMSSEGETLAESTKIFYSLGWAGFAACMYFNISFVCINIYDLCVGLRVSNRAKMDEARKRYYYAKIRESQKDLQSSNKDVINRWIKLGNLNNKSYGELPQINVRVEYFQIKKNNGKYELSIKKITRLQMKAKSKLRSANATTSGSKIECKIIISPASNNRLYSIFDEVYSMFGGPHVQTIRLKTFLNVWQKGFVEGQDIPLNRNLMFQRLERISYDGDVTKQDLESMLPEFPLDQAIINNNR